MAPPSQYSSHYIRTDRNKGGQTKSRTSGQQFKRTEGHKDRSGQEDSRTEGQKGNMTAGLEDRKQEEKEVGGPEGLRKGGQKT